MACSADESSSDPVDADAASAAPDAVAPDAAPAGALRILPLGDSLTLGFGSATDGAGTEAGYRRRLGERLSEDGFDFDFVGTQSNGPTNLDDRDHEGYNGYAVAQVGEVAATALPMFEPHIVLLMAGTNDQIEFVPPSQPPAGAAADLELLIEQIDTAVPGVQIVVAQVIPLTFNDEGVVEYNALLPALVERQQQNGVNVRLVDMYAIGVEQLSTDGIHPTLAGYDAIADIWYPAVAEAIGELTDRRATR